jgi:hypothetical protein
MYRELFLEASSYYVRILPTAGLFYSDPIPLNEGGLDGLSLRVSNEDPLNPPTSLKVRKLELHLTVR